MIDEKKLLVELEKWLDDTAYLKEKYSGYVQLKNGTGENIMCVHSEIVHDVLSTVINKINEQEKIGEWISISEKLPQLKTHVLVAVKYSGFMGKYGVWIKTGHLEIDGTFWGDCMGGEVIAWMPIPEYLRKTEKDK